jgi:uroporphyrinogen decarboxylase
MCTEPSAFGAKCVWPRSDFPYPERILDDVAQVDRLKKPDCRTDGLLPFVLKRLEHSRARLEAAGHRIRFATSRGPMNIASYLLGQTDFLTGLKLDPQRTHQLLRLTSEFICDWLVLQARAFDSIEGVLILDDLVGFVGAADFREFALPYLRQIFAAAEVPVKALHNDAHGLITARHLAEVGVNLFNFSFEHSLGQMRELAGPNVTLLGNLPPRDCLARGSAEEVRQATAAMLRSVDDPCRIVFSAGGGMPPGVLSENIDAFCAAVAGERD